MAKSAQRANMAAISSGSADMSSMACSMPRSRQYISKTQGETSQPMNISCACAATGSIGCIMASTCSTGNL